MALEFLGLVSIAWGEKQKTRTEVVCLPPLLAKLAELNVTLRDVSREAAYGETLMLKLRGGRGDVAELMDYADTPLTQQKREQMDRLNAFLSAANIQLDGKPVEPFQMVRIFLHDAEAPQWSRHGRLYRGFHLNLKKGERHRISIGGEGLCDLDWSACFIHIAYGLAGAAFPSGDPYGIPGLEHCRGTVKAIMSALLSRRAGKPGEELPPFRLPRGTALQLPEGWSGVRFLEAAKAYHAPIAHMFETPDAWAQTSFMESEMMLEVLDILQAEGCPALPCHDGLLCPKKFKLIAAAAMENVSRLRLGQAIPVTEKAILRPSELN